MKPKRSRKLRRVFVRTPKGISKMVYKRRNPSKVLCSICRKPLHGIKRLIPSKLRKLTKSRRRPERIYSGNICSSCTKRILIKKTRKDMNENE
ncbi:MAG: 50S ribosomal protein L34e [archaeon]